MGNLSEHFSISELACKHCGDLGPWGNQLNVLKLEDLRGGCGFALPITSGYRCPEHPIEVDKEPGEIEGSPHFNGLGIDVDVARRAALVLTVVAYELGWTGFGWDQKGDSRIVHIDQADDRANAPRPSCWSY